MQPVLTEFTIQLHLVLQSTSNYLARRYGVRAAMPGFIARKLCPSLVIVPVNFTKYRQVSEVVRGILKEYDPNFSPVGLDESYLNITEYVRRRVTTSSSSGALEQVSSPSTEPVAECHSNSNGEQPQGSCQSEDDGEDSGKDDEEFGEFYLPPSYWKCAEEVVMEMRSRIEQATSLTASAGIAPNKMLAKVASDMNKPNGQLVVSATKDGVVEFVRKLPIRKVSAIRENTDVDHY